MRPKSGFTLMFEAFIMTLAREIPVGPIAQLVKEHYTRIWRIIHNYFDQAREKEDFPVEKKLFLMRLPAVKDIIIAVFLLT